MRRARLLGMLRPLLVAGVALLGPWLGTTPASDAVVRHDRSPRKERAMSDKPGPITLTVTCQHDYLAGFPFLVSVELRNVSANVFELLPPYTLFNPGGPITLTLRGAGREWTWPAKPRRMEGEPGGIEFRPGSAWLALQDLSELHPDIPAGHYELTATAIFSGDVARSATVAFQIRPASHHDHEIAAKLRAANAAKVSSWRAFVQDNWTTPDTTGLSADARAQLAYYLFLHRAAYGPTAVPALDPGAVEKLGRGILEPEAAVLRLEILAAAKRPEAAGITRAVLERWPGLGWRVDEIHSGRGFLTDLRMSYGVEQGDAPKDRPSPYGH